IHGAPARAAVYAAADDPVASARGAGSIARGKETSRGAGPKGAKNGVAAEEVFIDRDPARAGVLRFADKGDVQTAGVLPESCGVDIPVSIGSQAISSIERR